MAVSAPSANPLMEWFRLNFFIPDTKTGWIRPALKRACRIIEEERPDIIFTSAPPYSVHLIGRALKRRYQLPWVADFRDPWLENHAYNTAPRMAPSMWINRRMESAVLNGADHIISTMQSQRRLLWGKTERSIKSFTTVPNGFEDQDWKNTDELERTSKFYVSHFGTIYSEGLDDDFAAEIARIVRKNRAFQRDFALRLIGSVPSEVQMVLSKELHRDNLHISPPVKPEMVQEMLRQEQLLLLLVNRGENHRYSHPSKVYEYMASGNPILAIGPADHEVMDILRQNAPDRSYICENTEQAGPKIEMIFDQWRKSDLPSKPRPDGPFTRRALTRKLAGIFDSTIADFNSR